jgi:hypothetical protein
MGTKTMKGVQEDVWTEFRSLAVKNRMKTGQFFEKLVKSYKEDNDIFWKDILSGEKIITDKEAKEMHKVVKDMRKEWGYRL